MTAVIDALRQGLTGRYEVQRLLGAGGMAMVYLAHDVKHDRDVAIKVMKPEIAQTLGAERFLREIQLAAQLSHPHILPLFDSGEAGGALYYVMPSVEGESVRDRLDQSKMLPVEDAVRIATEVAGALDYAHRHGVVHRDIKPENIMLHDGHALVADFGIGKALSAVEGEAFTQTGMSVGTPAYMSPEQAAGDAVDGRSDLYSLGCVLYEMLAGEQPFTGSTVQAVIAKRFVQTAPDVAGMREGVPRPVARAVQRALARAPIDRFETGAGFAAALREVDAAPAQAAAPDKSIAVLPFENLSSDKENEYFGDGIAEEIINALAQIEGLRVAARTSAFSFKGKPDDLRVIGEKLSVATVLEGSVRKSGNRIRITAQLIAVADGYHLWSERYDRELLDVFAVQDEIAAAIAAKLQVTFVKPVAEGVPVTPALVEAYELCVRGRALLMKRGRSLLGAIDCFERATALAPEYAPAFAGLGDAHLQASRYALGDTADHWVRGEAALDRALAIDPENAAALATRGGTTMSVQHGGRDIAGGLAMLDRALAINPRLSDGRIVLAFGLVFYSLDVARGLAEAARAVRDDPLSAYAGMMHGMMLSNTGQGAAAMSEADRAFALDPAAYLMHYARVWVRVAAGDMDGAFAAVTESLEIFGRDEHLLLMLPAIYLAGGERRKAEAVHAELRARAETSRVLAFALATCALTLGHADEGMAHALQSADAGGFQPIFWLRGWFNGLVASHPQYAELRRRMGA